jgi:predicted GNAT family N-acyltransferase
MSRPNRAEHYLVQEVGWDHPEARAQLIDIRTQVFIIEQGVPSDLEWDGLDENALHLLAFDSRQNPVGCARILANSVIGRMAVLKSHRGRGVGYALLRYTIDCCHAHGLREITLSAQVHALEFYRRAGFTVCSHEYLDAGIVHRDMKLSLNT